MGKEVDEFEFNTTCMYCGKDCRIWEDVDIGMGEIQTWCYCKSCDNDTFHDNGQNDSNEKT